MSSPDDSPQTPRKLVSWQRGGGFQCYLWCRQHFRAMQERARAAQEQQANARGTAYDTGYAKPIVAGVCDAQIRDCGDWQWQPYSWCNRDRDQRSLHTAHCGVELCGAHSTETTRAPRAAWGGTGHTCQYWRWATCRLCRCYVGCGRLGRWQYWCWYKRSAGWSGAAVGPGLHRLRVRSTEYGVLTAIACGVMYTLGKSDRFT